MLSFLASLDKVFYGLTVSLSFLGPPPSLLASLSERRGEGETRGGEGGRGDGFFLLLSWLSLPPSFVLQGKGMLEVVKKGERRRKEGRYTRLGGGRESSREEKERGESWARSCVCDVTRRAE